MNNPKTYIRSLRLIRLCTIAILLGGIVWSAIPTSPMQIDQKQSDKPVQESPEQSDSMQSIDETAFDVILWDVPPMPITPRQPEPTRVVRLSIQLMAITTIRDESGQPIQYGVLYDPDTDQLHTLSMGQEVNGFTLSEIKTDSITLQSGSREVRLLLDPDGDE